MTEMGSWAVQRFLFAWWSDQIRNRAFWFPGDASQRPSRYLDIFAWEGETTCGYYGRFCQDGCPTRPVPIVGDYDGDGFADPSVYRYTNSTWYMKTTTLGPKYSQWGALPDVPVPADYDGDHKTDPAVFRVPGGGWYVLRSTGGYAYTAWGTKNDIPVPADYDGDGRTDIAVWRPSSGTWYIRPSGGGAPYLMVQWGRGPGMSWSSDTPVPADYDGDGKADLAVFRPNEGKWYIKPSNNTAYIVRQWGTYGDIPVPGNYDGGVSAEMAVWRPSTGTWYILPVGLLITYQVHQWGTWGDRPAVGDFDNDHIADLAVFRPSNGTWYIKKSSGGFTVDQWGRAGDAPE